jgi:hypothetical protein
MKSLFLPLIYVGTITVWYSGTLAACAELGPDTANIESITGLKGVLNEKENTFKVSRGKALALAQGVKAAINTQRLAANK